MRTRILRIAMPAILMLLVISGCGKKAELVKAEQALADSRKSAKVNLLAGTTYYQSAPSYNSAFQTLIDNAVSGDVIVLRAGSHYVTNPIVIPAGKDGITIIGETGAVVRKAWNTGVVGILISGNYNTIHHIELDGGNLAESGIMIYGGHNNITDCKIHHCGNAGILLHMGAGPSCVVNLIEGCQIYNNAHVGISQSGHCDGRISWCQIYDNGYEGITVDNGSHNNVISSNEIHHNNSQCAVGGIGIDASNGTDIINNNIHHNYCRSGITFQNNVGGCDGTIITDNTISYHPQYGILRRNTQYPTTNTLIANNTMVGNAWGNLGIIP